MRNAEFDYNGFTVAQATNGTLTTSLWVAADGTDTLTGSLSDVLAEIDSMVAEREAIERLQFDFQVADALYDYHAEVERERQEIARQQKAAKKAAAQAAQAAAAAEAARAARIARIRGYAWSVFLLVAAVAGSVALYIVVM